MGLVSLPPVLLAMAVAGGAIGAARLQQQTIDGWNRYVAAVEARRAREPRTPGHALVMDASGTGTADRRTALSGALVVHDMTMTDERGRSLEVPDGLVHHWRGAVFLPGVTLDRLLARLESEAPPASPEVVRASILERRPSELKVFLRLTRTKVVTAVYDTEHDVRFTRIGPSLASSTSIATRIVEIENPGTAQEWARPAGHDRGFLWRLNAYWRYEAVQGGVMAECESISLSRDVPFGLGLVAGPIVSSTARESMERTLESLRSMSRQ